MEVNNIYTNLVCPDCGNKVQDTFHIIIDFGEDIDEVEIGCMNCYEKFVLSHSELEMEGDNKMKNLDEIMVLAAVVNNNQMGGYYLEICDEQMQVMFTCKDVNSYADYVRINRKYVDNTLWVAKRDVLPDILEKVQDEAMKHKDIFLLV